MGATVERSNHRTIWRRTSIGRWSEVDEKNSGVSFGLRRCLAWLPFLVPMPRHSRRSQLSLSYSMRTMAATVFSANILCVRHSMKGVGSSPSPSKLGVHSWSAIADDLRYRHECPIILHISPLMIPFSKSTSLNL